MIDLFNNGIFIYILYIFQEAHKMFFKTSDNKNYILSSEIL